MIKKQKGITLVSLIIIIAVLLIITSTTIYVSMDRFEINKLRKMENDIQLLEEKVANYYLKYNTLPILRDEENNEKREYPNTELDFKKDANDNEIYYIIDLKAMDNIMLNYGKEGFESPYTSEDVYIINEKSHTIYYVLGIEVRGVKYHYITAKNNNIEDEIPPSKPQIKVIGGQKSTLGDFYTSDIDLEVVPGADNWSGIEKTTISINSGEEIDLSTVENNIYKIENEGQHNITARTYDNLGNISETTQDFIINFAPTKSEIKIASGNKSIWGDFYATNVELQIVPGTDSWPGVQKTTISINDGEEIDIATLQNGLYKIQEDGLYNIKAKTYDSLGNISEETSIEITTNYQAIDKFVENNFETTDIYGNKIIIPAGFKLYVDDNIGYTIDTLDVTKGIVVEDVYAGSKGSQFVWIPVGTVYKDSSKTPVNIELNRYVFAQTTGEKTSYGTSAVPNHTSSYYMTEAASGSNEKGYARNIDNFISSVSKNSGYFIGRYEARTSNQAIRNSSENELTKVTTIKSNAVYNYVTQKQASDKSKEMYPEAGQYLSDLTNSYAWDTAIVFLQTFDNRADKSIPYSRKISSNLGAIEAFGTNEDVICNIYDMASNCTEWTTETCNHPENICTFRGGFFNSTDLYTAFRDSLNVTTSYDGCSFRPIIYFK